MQAPDVHGHFPAPPPGSFGKGGAPKYGTGVRAFDDVPDSWRPIPTGPVEERRATMTALKLSAFFFAVPALICMYGLIVLHRMSAREATGPEFGQPQALDSPKAMDSPSVSVWEEEEKGTIVFAATAGNRGGLDGTTGLLKKGDESDEESTLLGPQWTQRGWTTEGIGVLGAGSAAGPAR